MKNKSIEPTPDPKWRVVVVYQVIAPSAELAVVKVARHQADITQAKMDELLIELAMGMGDKINHQPEVQITAVNCSRYQ